MAIIAISGMSTAVRQATGTKTVVSIRGSNFSRTVRPTIAAAPAWANARVIDFTATRVLVELEYNRATPLPIVPDPVATVTVTITNDTGTSTQNATVEVDVFT